MGNCNRNNLPGSEDISQSSEEEGLYPSKGHKSPGRTWAGVAQIQTSASEIHIHLPPRVTWLSLCLTGKFPGRSAQKLPHLRSMRARPRPDRDPESKSCCLLSGELAETLLRPTASVMAHILIWKKGNGCIITSLFMNSLEAGVFETQSISPTWKVWETQLLSPRRIH